MIHGLDTGSRKWHVVGEDGSFAHHCVAASVPTDEARIELADSWSRYAKSRISHGDIVVCEMPLALRNGKTTIVLSMAAGALYLATFFPFGMLKPDEISWRWADVALWKRHIVGRGDADKEQIADWVQTHMHLHFEEPDHYDAACLVEFGLLWELLGHMPEPLKKKGKRKKT